MTTHPMTAGPKPIAPRADEAAREGYVSNIVHAWKTRTPDQISRGRTWYRSAGELAELISGGDRRQGAGVIAALSANRSWEANKQLAAAAFDAAALSGHVADALRKVERILSGEDPALVLPMSLKTGHFFRCIYDPQDADAVVVDRHAHDIAVGRIYGSAERGLSTPSRYALLAHCYREAAHRLGELPSAVQAATWLGQVERSRRVRSAA